MSRQHTLRWKRVILKLSGEALAGNGKHGYSALALNSIAKEIASASACGVHMGIVIGGGNLIRGSELESVGIERSSGDYMGMLATMANGVALQTVLEREGIATRVLSALPLSQVAEPFIRRRAIRHLEKGRIVICVGGTGNPHFTTDTAAALRARELHADVLLKGTTVDGVYTADPKKSKTAHFLKRASYKEMLTKDLRVMDLTAVTLAKEIGMPIIIFNAFKKGNLKRLLLGEHIGTEIT